MQEVSARKPTETESTIKCNNYHCYSPLVLPRKNFMHTWQNLATGPSN